MNGSFPSCAWERTLMSQAELGIHYCSQVQLGNKLKFHDIMSTQETKLWTIEKELWVENRLGLHARPAAKIATAAQQFDADITLEKEGLEVNARDLLDVLALDSPQGTRLVLRARGPQAREAATFIAALFARKFEEK
jgi:phosphocarrier protein